MKLSANKVEMLVESILGNYLGRNIEPGFLENLYRNLYDVLGRGKYITGKNLFKGEVDGEYKFKVLVDTDKIEYEKEQFFDSKSHFKNEEKVKFLSLSDGSCYVEYKNEVITPGMIDLGTKQEILFDNYDQNITKKAFILNNQNELRISCFETMKNNFYKNKMDGQIIMSDPGKRKNYSEKIYYTDNGGDSVRHIIRTYRYPDEIMDYYGLSNSDKYVVVNEKKEVSFNPTQSEILMYSVLEDELNEMMYGKAAKNNQKIKK